MMLVRVILFTVVVTSDVPFSAAEPDDPQQDALQDVRSFSLPPTRDVDMNAAGELFVLHKDQETVSLYHPDATAGFRLQWKRPAPAAPAKEEWKYIYGAGDGRTLLHAYKTETVLVDSDGREAGRWQVKDRFLVAASSSHVVYREGSLPDFHLHVYGIMDHGRRLFSLRSADDGGMWGNPYVSIGPDGRYFVVDFRREQLAAFSPTGERLYEQKVDYKAWKSPAVNPDRVFVIDYLQRAIHVHEAGSGAAVPKLKLTYERLQLHDREWTYGVWAGQADILYLRVEDRDYNCRIITYPLKMDLVE